MGPSNTGYPGAFPRGLINKVRRKWWGNKRLWLFSGTFKDSEGTTVDIKEEVCPDVVANCEALPFEDDFFDFVFADPPYSEKEAMELYNLEYPSMVKVLNEMARVTKPGGYCILLHRIIPSVHPSFNHHFKRLILEGIVGVFTIAGLTNIRALTVWKKNGSIFDTPQIEVVA